MDSAKFDKKLEFAMKQDLVDKNVSHKLDNRIKGFEAELQGKVKLLDMVMNGLINEAKEEFLIKPSTLQTRDKLREYIDANLTKPTGKKDFVDKKISYFDIVDLKKITHFTDHKHDYITKSGFKIDNYNLEKNKPQA